MTTSPPDRVELRRRLLSALPKCFRRHLARLQPSGPALLVGAGILVGLLTGAGVWLFKQVIVWTHTVFFGWIGGVLTSLGPWTVALFAVRFFL